MDGASCEMKHLHKSLTAGFSDLSSQEEGDKLKKKNAHSGEYCLSFNKITLKYNKHRNMCAIYVEQPKVAD